MFRYGLSSLAGLPPIHRLEVGDLSPSISSSIVIGPTHTPEDLVERTWPRMTERPVFARLFAWLILEQQDVTVVITRHPLLETAVRHAHQDGDPDPVVAATAPADDAQPT